jgi:hypothetical protein
MRRYGFKLKGTGPIQFHLGSDYFRDQHGVLCFAPKKYIEKMIETYVRMFGQKPKHYVSPLAKGDHPELDTTDELDINGIKQFQSMVGALQWAVQIGRFDITTAVMTLSSFRANPRQGHLDRCKRIYGYLSKMRNAVARVRTEEPDYSAIPKKVYDWEQSVYAGAEEVVPDDAPLPLGQPVVMTSYLRRRQSLPRSGKWQICYRNPTSLQQDGDRLVLQETVYSGDSYLRIRICCCPNCHGTNHRPSSSTTLLRSRDQRKHDDVRRQRIGGK